jgi:hypothetical protein
LNFKKNSTGFFITPDLKKREEKWTKTRNQAKVLFTKTLYILYEINKKLLGLQRSEKNLNYYTKLPYH